MLMYVNHIKEIIPILYNLFWKIHSNLICEVKITLMPKSDKEITRKLNIDEQDAKIL
jgi:hypothetical protein